MGKAMTVRLSEDEEKALKKMACKMNWSGVKSKALRFSVMFTLACMEQLPNLSKLSYYNVSAAMNAKFKTKIDDWRYR